MYAWPQWQGDTQGVLCGLLLTCGRRVQALWRSGCLRGGQGPEGQQPQGGRHTGHVQPRKRVGLELYRLCRDIHAYRGRHWSDNGVWLPAGNAQGHDGLLGAPKRRGAAHGMLSLGYR